MSAGDNTLEYSIPAITKVHFSRRKTKILRYVRCVGMVEKGGKEFRGHFSARENFSSFREGLSGVPKNVPPAGKRADFPPGVYAECTT